MNQEAGGYELIFTLACPGMSAFEPAGEPAGSTAPPGGRLETTARKIGSDTPVQN